MTDIIHSRGIKLMLLDNFDPILYLSRIIILILAISVHEFAHALAADWLGDPTPRSQGRLTLDPRKHLDAFGSIMFLIAGFGWGKPVYTDPRNFKGDPRTGMAVVAAAGPASNLLLAYIGSILYRLGLVQTEISYYFLFLFVSLNILLMLFNLIPISPLDGYQVTVGLLPYEIATVIARYQGQGPLMLMLLIVAGSIFNFNLLGLILGPPYQLILGLLLN
ncbi:MAG: site-2 protease family protein [Anaerolineaceae bacterium]|nr:site-2 protease family protein [Anaerolineaceae bacterium]